MTTPTSSRCRTPFLWAACLLLGWTSCLQARPAHKRALVDYLGPFLVKKLNDCRTCHVADNSESEEEKAHNAFGERLKAVRKERAKAGQPNDLASSLDALADADADGDGVANLVELLAGRNPGEAADKPTAAEAETAIQKRPDFIRLRTGYQWRPFEVVKRPVVPQVKNTSWVRNPLDAFIAAEHEARGLKPNPEAARPILIRRLYLDLLGVPPTRGELQAALTDPSPTWYENLVDTLLGSGLHGERWGRHWMDVWRYSDWYGYNAEIRNSLPHVWRWRDWIVEALNADKPYDRMIVEMLAGDELAPDDLQIVRATGYLVRSHAKLSREKWLQDTVEHAFQGFLGVTIGCARCHDHMYDPISHKEYYQVRAFFEPHQVRLDNLPGDPNTLKNGFARAYDDNLTAPTYFLRRGDPMLADKTASILPGVPAALGGRLPDIVPIKLPASVYDPENREFVIQELIAAAEKELAKARANPPPTPPKATEEQKELLRQQAKLDVELMTARLASLAATHKASALDPADKDWKAAALAATTAQRHLAVMEARKRLLTSQQFAVVAGSASAKAYYTNQLAMLARVLAAAEATAKKEPSTEYVKRAVKTYSPTSSGRRLALARWIGDQSNPLTARVAMNHVWLRHFGQALVPSVFDFGRNGRPATHPALMDWLAAEFMERGWSFKAMHRLMVTSATYRMAATSNEGSSALDRDNVAYWRLPSRRMEAEVVRDSVLHVAGRLDLTRGGPDINHNQGLFVPRRSIYFNHAEDQQMEFLKLFDAASTTECYERTTSVSPQQALALANSDLTIRQARILARGLVAELGKEPAAFVNAAFAAVLTRPPTDEERGECLSFLQLQTQLYGPPRNPQATVDEKLASPDPEVRARENLVRVLFNHHDFLTIR